MKPLAAAVSAICLSLAVAHLGVAAGEADAPGNLVANPSFEQPGNAAAMPDGWHGDAQVYGTDATVSHSGQAALKFVNDDPKRYRLCTQRVRLPPGSKCRFSAWVKTKDIRGSDSGATICLEWQDRNGKWLGGRYPSGVKGSSDWTRVEEIIRLPEDAASCTVACYVRQGMTGTAWFDDVEVVRLVDPPMRTVLLAPVYRGRITAGGPAEARVRARLNLADHDLKAADLRIEARLLSTVDNKVLWESAFRPGGTEPALLDLAVPLRGLPVGHYDLALRLLGPNDKELQTAHHALHRVPDNSQPGCAIDEHRRLLVDGRPFFPIGMYFGSITEADLKVYAQSKFNCLMPYGTPTKPQMDLAQQYGLKVIYSIKDWYAGSRHCPQSIRSQSDEEPQVRARVRQFRDHPALLAWYLNDELPQQFLPRLEAHQTWVMEEDPGHPTWCVLYQVHEVAAYWNTFDVIGTDPYPIGRGPASMAAEWTAETFRQVERARPMWQVPQAHNWGNYAKGEGKDGKARTPSYEEERSMAWQCICEGATGLVFYSWYDVQRNPDVPFAVQWEGLKRIAAEIDRMAPMLLSVEPAPAVNVRGPVPSQDAPRWLHWLARRHNGRLYVFAVNDGDGEGAIQFGLPQPPRSIRVLGEDRSVRADGKAFEDDFRRLSVHIYEIDPAGPWAGKPRRSPPGIRRVVVENCAFYSNSRDWGACITLMGAKDVLIRNNVFVANHGHIFTITQHREEDAGVDRKIRILGNTVYQPPGMREIAVFVVRCPLKGFEVKNNVFCTRGAGMDVKPEQVTETTVFDYNVYGPSTETPLRVLGQEKHGSIVRGRGIGFVKPPAAPAGQRAVLGPWDLHLKSDSPGANGAPLLSEASHDHDGKPRRAAGPYGAYADLGNPTPGR